MADPVQMRAKEKRLAEALRANLKRRKAAARELLTLQPEAVSAAPVTPENAPAPRAIPEPVCPPVKPGG